MRFYPILCGNTIKWPCFLQIFNAIPSLSSSAATELRKSNLGVYSRLSGSRHHISLSLPCSNIRVRPAGQASLEGSSRRLNLQWSPQPFHCIPTQSKRKPKKGACPQFLNEGPGERKEKLLVKAKGKEVGHSR